MKAAEATILILPGFGDSGPEHWQSRWQAKLSTARRVMQADWNRASRASWVPPVVAAVAAADKPVVVLAHSLGVATLVHAAPDLGGKVAGALLVAPTNVARPDLRPEIDRDFAPLPRDPLPFPSLLVASRNDPYCGFDVAEEYAAAWGAMLVDAGESGHINVESGHGPWPDGLLRFATFLGRL